MRDIRADLQERKEALVKEIQELETALKAKNASLAPLDDLIAAESVRWSNGNGKTHQVTLFQAADINEFIVGLLQDGKPRTTEEIRDIAVTTGLDFDGKAPGRSINFRLVGLQRLGQVKKNESTGTWTR